MINTVRSSICFLQAFAEHSAHLNTIHDSSPPFWQCIFGIGSQNWKCCDCNRIKMISQPSLSRRVHHWLAKPFQSNVHVALLMNSLQGFRQKNCPERRLRSRQNQYGECFYKRLQEDAAFAPSCMLSDCGFFPPGSHPYAQQQDTTIIPVAVERDEHQPDYPGSLAKVPSTV